MAQLNYFIGDRELTGSNGKHAKSFIALLEHANTPHFAHMIAPIFGDALKGATLPCSSSMSIAISDECSDRGKSLKSSPAKPVSSHTIY